MKARSLFFAFILLLIIHCAKAVPAEGFFLPDSVREVTFDYRSINNLIVLPVRINDDKIVNLVLDTGCRNLVLFGKRFRNMIDDDTREITFNGLGQGKPARGYVTLGNNVSFNRVSGKKIAIVVVPERNVLASYPAIDGVIGYELFMKFEIEVNFARQKITFRPARSSSRKVISNLFRFVSKTLVPSFHAEYSSLKMKKKSVICLLTQDHASAYCSRHHNPVE